MKFATSIRFNYLMLALLLVIVTMRGLDSGPASQGGSYWMAFLALLDHWLVYFVLPVTTGFAIAAKLQREKAQLAGEHRGAADAAMPELQESR